jgi:hypothetical protein
MFRRTQADWCEALRKFVADVFQFIPVSFGIVRFATILIVMNGAGSC